MDAIALFAFVMDSDKDTYSNLLEKVASLMPELVITNKNLVEALR